MELTTQKPKLILTDLDGTLLRDDKTLSPANRAALERAAGQGAQVVLSTGRSYKSLSQELRDLPFLRYFILVNGAKVYDLQTDTVLYRAEVPMDVAQGLFQMFEPLDACIDCYQNDTGLMDRKYYDHLERYIDDPHALKMTQDCRRIISGRPSVPAAKACRSCKPSSTRRRPAQRRSASWVKPIPS